MASPTMSYLICSMALIVLILVLPSFFEIQRVSIAENMTRRELTEIADYTSNALSNLFFLAESADASDNSLTISMTKDLLYLPLTVGDSFYVLNITDVDDSLKLVAYVEDQQWISGESWIAPGLKRAEHSEEIYSYELGSKIAVANCTESGSAFYISLEFGEK
ncbi:hypothetical protein E2P60_02840 [Candidatus Bathyarchaeota archaeon]|nr:hypothetical protein E2P60_02840 [Candidatus Bathyarchaeota archaeon]